ncbi:MAG: bifunctional riboflavin kinase/FMN adenylyltransferase [Alphaproteobacteria bacterium]|nr:MAG: bifunctional riboflavin kinase/FMN adenylyltransferase [Alphaproteobacteria bacterium]
MQLFDAYKNTPPNAQECVVIIGNFDGVHLGHQALIDKARIIAKKSGKPLAVLTFEPHPRQLFRPDEPPCRITPQLLKAERLASHDVDYVFSLPFDWDFASQSAADFVQNILIDGLNASHIIVGDDFKFGQLRKGTPQTIMDAGLPTTVIDEVKGADACDLSSSHVRQLLRKGKIDEANAILGWNWEIRGEIFKGDQRGRELGYPTANMKLDNIIHPAYGVYACLARIEGEDTWMKGAANIGIRPMFEVPAAQVETFIFDFDREIYGETLCVRPIKRLRGEAKFNSLDDLIVQMEKDCDQAKGILKDIV